MSHLSKEDLEVFNAMNDGFVSLLGSGTQLKQRKCLKCLKRFRSLGAGHRICANCKRINAKVSPNAGYKLDIA